MSIFTRIFKKGKLNKKNKRLSPKNGKLERIPTLIKKEIRKSKEAGS